LRAVLLDATLHIDAQKRHKLIAILNETAAVGDFEPAAIDLLKLRNQRERYGLGLLRTGAEYQKRRQIFVAGVHIVINVGFLRLRHRGGAAQRLCNPVRIEDHDNRPVTENRGAGKSCDVAQPRRHRLDHDFLGVEHAVDNDAKSLSTDLGNDDKAFAAFTVALADMQDFP